MTTDKEAVRANDLISALEHRIALLESKLQSEPALHIQYVIDPTESTPPATQGGEGERT